MTLLPRHVIEPAEAIDRAHPACLLLLIDRSLSATRIPRSPFRGRSRTDAIAAAASALLDVVRNLAIVLPSLSEHLWFGAIRYSNRPEWEVLAKDGAPPLNPVGRLRDSITAELSWLGSCPPGATSMCSGLRLATAVVSEWTRRHAHGFPAVVVHFTDGHATDGDPEDAAAAMKATRTHRGPTILVNVILSQRTRPQIVLPGSDQDLPDGITKKFFRISSPAPRWMRSIARLTGLPTAHPARALLIDVDPRRWT